MKKYQHPQTTIFSLRANGYLAQSFTLERNNSNVTYSTGNTTEEQFSRKHQGCGPGLWEDMK